MYESDLGSYYQHEDGTLWRLIAYTANPTATLERVVPAERFDADPVRRSGVVGAPIMDGFTKMVPLADLTDSDVMALAVARGLIRMES